jgi:Ca-activated chloride channel family protein
MVGARASGVASVGALLALSWTLVAAPAQQQPSFRAGTQLVSLPVTVNVGGTTRYMTGLEASDFEVYEDGVKQTITIFNNSNSPIALSLLLDTSASMDTRLRTAQEAAIGFSRTVREQDLAEIIDFDTRVTVLQPFTNDVALLEKAIRRTSADGTTGMFNAIYVALSELKKLAASEGPLRRKAIVVVSDGEDTTSMLEFDGPDGILSLTKQSENTVYAVGLRAPDEPKTGFKRAEYVLRQLAQQTGGRAFFPGHVNDLTDVYTQIAEELSSQYTVGYTPKNTRRDGTWRRLVVRVNKPDAVVRTKQGYLAPR